VSAPAQHQTARLLLRQWTEADLAPFAALNADPRVGEHLTGPMTAAESNALIEDRIVPHWQRWGFGLYAVQALDDDRLLGFVGLSHHRAFPDDVEIGWRLARDVWGKGYATEAAHACVELAFGVLGLDHLIAVTTEANVRSWRVMEKVGMRRWREDVPFEDWKLLIYRLDGPARADNRMREGSSARLD